MNNSKISTNINVLAIFINYFSVPYLTFRIYVSEWAIGNYMNASSYMGRKCSIRKMTDSPAIKELVSGVPRNRLEGPCL